MLRNVPMSQTAILGALMASLIFTSVGRAEEKTEYEKLIADQSAAFVTVKFMLKMEGGFGDEENESEITGVMIEPQGLVLCSNGALGGSRFFRRMGSARPTDIKVLIGDDTEGLPATLLARDSELDLAWVRIDKPGEKPLACIDLKKAGNPSVGHRLLALRRMGKFFDHAFVATDGKVCGKVRKPRDMFVPGGGLELERGMPVFTDDGRVVGVIVTQTPDDEEMESGFRTFMMSGGRDMFSDMILPAAEVLKATERAKQAKPADEEAADEKGGDDAKGEKDDAKSSDKKIPKPTDGDEEGEDDE